MFEQIYSNLKKRYQQSWFRFFLQYTALGKLLEHHTTVDAVTFYDTCLSSWWWNRLWLRSFMEDRYCLQQFDTVLKLLWLLEKAEISTQENRDLVVNHAHPESLVDAFSYLQKTRILTQENLVLVAHHAHPYSLAHVLSYLQTTKILTPENFLLIANHAHPDNLASALFYLQTTGILTPENFALVTNHTHSEGLISALSYLQTAGILTQENLVLIAKHDHPDRLVFTLSYLQYARILTQENFILVAKHAHSEGLVSALSYLQYAGILTEENFMLVARHAHPAELVCALSYLQTAGILTEENFMLVAEHDCPAELVSALSDLQYAEIVTQENFVLVANHANPYNLASALSDLQTAGILTPENFTLVANHAHPENLTPVLFILYSSDILIQANFEALLTPDHKALIAAETQRLIWSRIPRHLLTQDNFDSLVRAAEQTNPMAALQRALHVILGLDILAGAPAAFNRAQSTHTASVHRSVSASAARLMKNYGTGLNVTATIEKIKRDVNGLDDSFKHLATKRCIKRIASPDNTFTDSSGVTTRQLLALAYLAIHDESKRQGTQEEAQALFIDGLYEIQRGYNLDAQGIDNQSPVDAPICLAGTFNKLMEKLNGIHPDVELCFITHEGLGLKFPKVVEDCVCNHLNHLTSPETATGYVMVKKLLDGMKDNGLEPIWDKIKTAVEARLWDEFKEAYANNPEDPRFRAMIEHGHYSNAPDLTAFYAQLEASSGYEAFLYQLQQKNLAEQQFFFRANRHTLWANRYHSADDQKAFDRELTMVSFNKSP